MHYIFHIAIMLNIYIMLVLSANLTIGMANLLTMCQAAFYGIGAYIGTYFLMQHEVPFVIIVAIVALVTGATSFLVSYASVKLKGDYFVLATIPTHCLYNPLQLGIRYARSVWYYRHSRHQDSRDLGDDGS